MPANPTDYNTYLDPAPLPVEPVGYPKMMYHPTNPSQVVNSAAQEASLVAMDPLWSETDPNATT